jgi:fatty acid desaturase
MTSELYKYRDLFGKPNEGVHHYRIFDIAIVDVAVVIIFGILIARFTKYPIWITLVVLFVLGVIAHRAFYVRSTIDKLLFPNS